MSRALPFTSPYLLAPMEGVTEPCFRDLVLARNAPEALGGAFTEFVRVCVSPIPRAVIRRHLGPSRFAQPVGVQLMGADLGHLARTAQNAVEAGAPLVDLNFGCPSKGALAGCAGSSLLRDPLALEKVVRAVVDAVAVPVTAKIRAGYTTPRGSRTSRAPRRAAARRSSPSTAARAPRATATRSTGAGSRARCAPSRSPSAATAASRATPISSACAARPARSSRWSAAARSPTLDLQRPARRAEPRRQRSCADYADAMRERGKLEPRGVAARIKQLLRHWTAGGLVPDAATRTELLRERDGEALLARLQATARERRTSRFSASTACRSRSARRRSSRARACRSTPASACA